LLLEGVDPRFRRRELCLELSVPARILFRFSGRGIDGRAVGPLSRPTIMLSRLGVINPGLPGISTVTLFSRLTIYADRGSILEAGARAR
jgi:hypothetical protein